MIIDLFIEIICVVFSLITIGLFYFGYKNYAEINVIKTAKDTDKLIELETTSTKLEYSVANFGLLNPTNTRKVAHRAQEVLTNYSLSYDLAWSYIKAIKENDFASIEIPVLPHNIRFISEELSKKYDPLLYKKRKTSQKNLTKLNIATQLIRH